MYGADPVYLDAVEGLYPDKAKHEAYVVIEPVSLTSSRIFEFLNKLYLYREFDIIY